MRIGITTEGQANPYASVLAARLVSIGHKPELLIRVQRSRAKVLLRELQSQGVLATVGKIARRGRQDDDNLPGQVLRDYADQHDLPDCDLSLRDFCNRQQIRMVEYGSLNDSGCVDLIKRESLDLLLNAGGGIFRKKMIETVGIGILNAHMGPLPKYRGMNALEWTLFHGDQPGVTVHYIDRGIDTGDLICFRELPISAHDNLLTLRARSLTLNIDLICEAVQSIGSGGAQRIKQQAEQGRQYFVMHPRLKRLVKRQLPMRH